MTVTEANAWNVVVAYVLDMPGSAQPGESVDEHHARAGRAAEFLAERARKALSAGPSPAEIRDAWPLLLLPSRDVEDPSTAGVAGGDLGGS